MLIRSFVNAVLLNRQTGESETPTTSVLTRGSIIVLTESAFKAGDRVRNTKTDETGTVAPVSPKDVGTTPVIYDKEFDNWGTIWDTPNHRLELIT